MKITVFSRVGGQRSAILRTMLLYSFALLAYVCIWTFILSAWV